MPMVSEVLQESRLFKTVVRGGYCVGCGACASVRDSAIQISLNAQGLLTAVVGEGSKGDGDALAEVCPFSDKSLNEDQIASQLFAAKCQHHEKIGYHLATYAGHVLEGDFRQRGSSGGMGSWVVSKLLSEGLVDAVVHVQRRNPTEVDARLFEYQVSDTLERICEGAKSRYYPIEMSQVMKLVRERPGRYAVVGIPCFIKAVRLLMNQDSALRDRIVFCVGLICGHLKSTQFAAMFAWQCGIEPERLLAIDFRRKLTGRGANDYGVEVTGISDGKVATDTRAVRDLFGYDWGLGLLKYKACDYCDDVVAETADVAVGDAWLTQYLGDSRGTNVVVVRHHAIQGLIENAIANGQLSMDWIDPDEVARSQTAGLNHRREGLAYRLHLADKQGVWRPRKRVKPNAGFSRKFQRRHVLRMELAEKSHTAFYDACVAKDFSVFISRMEPLIRRYRLLYRRPLWKRIAVRLGKALLNYIRSFAT